MLSNFQSFEIQPNKVPEIFPPSQPEIIPSDKPLHPEKPDND
ncbi:hypothetical protein [Vulcanibacillus modesticaldus]|nr:hypothetical protein [Vulcanibacillus modesticaldus]